MPVNATKLRTSRCPRRWGPAKAFDAGPWWRPRSRKGPDRSRWAVGAGAEHHRRSDSVIPCGMRAGWGHRERRQPDTKTVGSAGAFRPNRAWNQRAARRLASRRCRHAGSARRPPQHVDEAPSRGPPHGRTRSRRRRDGRPGGLATIARLGQDRATSRRAPFWLPARIRQHAARRPARPRPSHPASR